VIDSAREANMPMDNIDRAIKKGTGELPGVSYEETMYEGYGPSGVAVMVRVLTDNKNRTTAEMRHIFEKYGGSMGSANSVAWLFQPKGIFYIAKDKATEDAVMEIALDAGADDVEADADGYTVTTAPDAYDAVKKAFKDKGIATESAELARVASNKVTLNEKDAEKALRLIDQFEEHDDVQQVFSNSDISDEIMEKIAAKEAAEG
jgi:YebC/PmpR family DNA-binding regulatory protein